MYIHIRVRFRGSSDPVGGKYTAKTGSAAGQFRRSPPPAGMYVCMYIHRYPLGPHWVRTNFFRRYQHGRCMNRLGISPMGLSAGR
jgi:hypothetical protein